MALCPFLIMSTKIVTSDEVDTAGCKKAAKTSCFFSYPFLIINRYMLIA